MNALKAYKKHQAELSIEAYEKAKAEEEAKVAAMTIEERQAYYKEKEARRKKMFQVLSIPMMLNGMLDGPYGKDN